MSQSFFRFKQFTIHQDACAMKVGTDGVLLGVLADVTSANNLLDIGTGTGLVSLMLAQRKPSLQIDAIEIDADAAQQAQEKGLFVQQLIHIHSRANKPPKRIVMAFARTQTTAQEEHLIIEEEQRHHYSAAFAQLTAPFYLDRD